MNTRAGRILLVLPSLDRGGGERVLLQLARSFSDMGREVHVATLLGGGALRSEVPAAAILHELVGDGGPVSGGGLACQALPRLVSLLRAIKPQAVLSTMTGTNLLVTMACMFLHAHVRLVLREASSVLNTRSVIKRLAMRWLYRRASAVVAVSGGVAEDLRGLGVRNDRICVIRNPVDQVRLRSLSNSGPTLPELAGRPYVIALGRLTEAKDYPTLLRAYASSKLRQSHCLLFVGDGRQRALLESMVRDLDIRKDVLFPGEVDNPFRMLAEAALLVLSSRWEGYPNVLLEALALNIPVVSTDCRHGPRELLDDGCYGRLVPVGDAVALAHAMDAGVQCPPHDSTVVLESHSPQLIASEYLRVLDGPPCMSSK